MNLPDIVTPNWRHWTPSPQLTCLQCDRTEYSGVVLWLFRAPGGYWHYWATCPCGMSEHANYHHLSGRIW